MTPEDAEEWKNAAPARKDKATEAPEAKAKPGKEAKGAEDKKK